MSENNKFIKIFGAKENNLKNIDVSIPKNKLVIMTGVSGSGKTSLAFDTLYQEGQRRYVESLSTYARQFLGNFEKPKVDKIEGLSPSISIEQKSTSQNPRSTVGTVTEIYDFYRLLFSKIGIPYSPVTNEPLTKQTISEMYDIVKNYEIGSKVIVMSPVVERRKGQFLDFAKEYLAKGFNRVIVDNNEVFLDDFPELNKNSNHDISIIVDRLILKEDLTHRLYEALELATTLSNGKVICKINDEILYFNEKYSAKGETFTIPELEPRLFSFNTPIGACSDCKGLGFKMKVDNDLILDYDTSLNDGAIIPYKNADEDNLVLNEVLEVCKYFKIDINKKISKLTEKELELVLYGTDEDFEIKLISKSGRVYYKNQFEGIVNLLERRYLETTSEWIRDWIQAFMRESVCNTCHGARLNKEALCVKINNLNIYELTKLSIKEELEFFENLKLNKTDYEIANLVLQEVTDRLSFLQNVGLDYLNLSRQASTLSGGEAQRIRLATQVGSKLSGVLYVLDEPSIGLHQKDNKRLIETLKQMRDLDNTLVVVEHDEETMLESDYIIDIGPYAGMQGGYLVACGTPEEIISNDKSLTGKYLAGKLKVNIPDKRRKINKKEFISVKNASENNLKNIDIKFYLGVLTIVTGVSGSGKSTLVNQILLRALKNKYYKNKDIVGKVDEVNDFNKIERIVEISQSPIGKTPRSNPATYTGVFDDIRTLFSQTKEARARGYDKGRFSFNLKGGRCENCKGDGVKKITMHFLPDVYVKCEVCNGKRYNRDTLDIRYKDKTISDVLDMTIDQAKDFFETNVVIKNKLDCISDVGLGYIQLGQQAPSLSGGEAQRVKLASELYKRSDNKTLYILDEPTTGLHTDDVNKLIKVLQKIVDNGSTMIIIEHNLDVIKQADYIIDLGPDGGNMGGNIVCQGTPEEVILNENSYTGIYLKKIMEK